MRIRSMVATVALLAIGTTTPSVAQNAPAQPTCAPEIYHQFDYWVGEYNVVDTSGTKIAESSIKSVAAGCAISETWRPIGGPEGVSISWYNPQDEMWHQQWVGGSGWIAWFDGGLVDGNMTLTTKPNPAAPNAPISRMVYTQPREGVVRQTVLASRDNGETWVPNFIGDYVRK